MALAWEVAKVEELQRAGMLERGPHLHPGCTLDRDAISALVLYTHMFQDGSALHLPYTTDAERADADKRAGEHSYYLVLNRLLRKNDPRIEGYIPMLTLHTSALKQLRTHAGDAKLVPPLFRGIKTVRAADGSHDLWDEYPIGRRVTWDAFTSTTTTIDSVSDFLKGGGGDDGHAYRHRQETIFCVSACTSLRTSFACASQRTDWRSAETSLRLSTFIAPSFSC